MSDTNTTSRYKDRHLEMFGEKSRHHPDNQEETKGGDSQGQGEAQGGRSSGGGMTLDQAPKGEQAPIVEPADVNKSKSTQGEQFAGAGMTLDMAQKANKGDQEPAKQAPAVEPADVNKAPSFKPSSSDNKEKDAQQPAAAKNEPQKLRNLDAIQPPPDIMEWRAQKAAKAQAAAAPIQSQSQTEVQAQGPAVEVQKPRTRTM